MAGTPRDATRSRRGCREAAHSVAVTIPDGHEGATYPTSITTVATGSATVRAAACLAK